MGKINNLVNCDGRNMAQDAPHYSSTDVGMHVQRANKLTTYLAKLVRELLKPSPAKLNIKLLRLSNAQDALTLGYNTEWGILCHSTVV